MPRFSIIITCYNQGSFIKEAVDSALAQTCCDREIIVVDDGSTDESRHVLEAYVGAIAFEPSETNQGAVATRNRGASIARGDFLVFLDGDDCLQPWALAVYASLIDWKCPKLILAKMLFFRGALPLERTVAYPAKIEVIEYEDYFSKDRAYRASASAMVVERQTFFLVGGWTAGTFPADDQDLLYKLGCAGRTLQILSPETSAYRLHASNTTRYLLPLVDALHGLLERERNGLYPGGHKRRFARHAVMGGFVFYMVRQTWQHHLRGRALNLLVAGWSMILAAMQRRSIGLLCGRGRHTEQILFYEKACSPAPHARLPRRQSVPRDQASSVVQPEDRE